MNLYIVNSTEATPDGAHVVLADSETVAREVVTARHPNVQIARIDLVKRYPDLIAEASIVGTISVTPARR